MKIPPNHSRPISQPESSQPPRRPADTAVSSRPEAAAGSILRPGAGWSKAALDDPAAAARIFSEALGQIIDASPTASQLRPAQRQQLERNLAADPVMRDLVARSMERSLK